MRWPSSPAQGGSSRPGSSLFSFTHFTIRCAIEIFLPGIPSPIPSCALPVPISPAQLVSCNRSSLAEFRGTWAATRQPRQGRKIVAHGVSRGEKSPHPASGTPLPRGRERGWGRGSAPLPMAYAMGYVLTPAPRAEFLNELLRRDTRSSGFPPVAWRVGRRGPRL